MSIINQYIPLYLSVDPPGSGSNTFYGFIAGSDYDNIIGTFDMLLAGEPLEGSSINFFVEGFPNPIEITSSINFHLRANATTSNNYLSFHTLGAISNGIIETSSFPMLIAGSGITENNIPINQEINFFLHVSPGANNNFPMVIPGQDIINNDFSLYILGIEDNITDEVPMVIQGQDVSSAILRMFIRGYN